MSAAETLLVVENEVAIKALVQMTLERVGYVVLTAESGSEALRLAADHHGPIDLLITDVVMPPALATATERLTGHAPAIGASRMGHSRP